MSTVLRRPVVLQRCGRRHLSLAWQNLNSKSRLKGVIIDANVLIKLKGEEVKKMHASKQNGTGFLALRDTEQLLKEGKAAELLATELREELRKRGAEAVGFRHQLVERLQELVIAEAAAAARGEPVAASNSVGAMGKSDTVGASVKALHCIAGDSKKAVQSDVPEPSKKAPSVRDKYEEKLRARSAKGAASGEKKVGGNVTAMGSPMAGEDFSAGNGWNFQPGARDLLRYLEMRGISRALVPSMTDSAESARAQAETLERTMQVTPFNHVLPASQAAEMSSKVIVDACQALGLSESAVMVVTDAPRELDAAKAAGVMRCYFAKSMPGRAKKLPADFVVDTMLGVQHCVEDLNGFTFRSADTVEVVSAFRGG